MNNKGSFTIEAAVIISMIVFIINAILFLTFFLFNRCSVERAAAAGSLRGSQLIWGSNAERQQAASEGIRDVLSFNLLGAESVESRVEVRGDKVYTHVSGSIRDWEYEAEYTKKAMNPVMLVRACRKVKALEKMKQNGAIEGSEEQNAQK